ncbi:MAG: T9SS type A sorting domain-containing protein [Flavobacteriales bacterium]|nr:T9SS type A sorting domain-containing protein [Flavobacteriales bacterium]
MKKSLLIICCFTIISNIVNAQYWKPGTPNYTGKTTFCFDEIMVLDTIEHPDSLTYESDYENSFYYIYDTSGCPTTPGLNLNTKGSDGHKLTFDGKVPHNRPFDLYIRSVRLWSPDKVNHQFLHSDSCQKITISVDTLPTPKLTNDTLIKQGDSLMLSVKNYTKTKWSTGDTSTSIVVKVGGKYWVEVESQNGCKGSDTMELTIEKPNSVFINNTSKSISLFPNPNQGVFTINTNSSSSIRVINLTSKQVANLNLNKGGNSVDLSHLEEGMYILVDDKSGTYTRLSILNK